MPVRIALVGDYDANVIAHRAIPEALRRAATAWNPSSAIQFDWKHTATLGSLEGYHGVWCVPASPYASEVAALGAIRWARENRVPFLGTCGGFQHAILEFARNVMGMPEADHAETATSRDCLVISRLTCPLVEVERSVFAVPGTRLADLYGSREIPAGYHCNFGFDRKFEPDFEEAGMRVAARDADGEPRAVELIGHPFFIGTLFQPERLALKREHSPVVGAFVESVFSFAMAHAPAGSMPC